MKEFLIYNEIFIVLIGVIFTCLSTIISTIVLRQVYLSIIDRKNNNIRKEILSKLKNIINSLENKETKFINYIQNKKIPSSSDKLGKNLLQRLKDRLSELENNTLDKELIINIKDLAELNDSYLNSLNVDKKYEYWNYYNRLLILVKKYKF